VTSFPWYVARAAGLVSWVLLTAGVLWGLAISTRVLRGRPRPAWLLDLHRYLAGLATIFAGVHFVAILFDQFVHFDLVSVLVPLASTWHPVAVAWGVAGLYLLLAVEITSLVRTRVPKRLWRATHYASFPLFAFATIHALSAGTDTRTWLFEIVAATAVMVIGYLIAVRASNGSRRRAPVKPRTAYGERPPGLEIA